jgi:RimJ/RimL family protein N-acetyltransferase
MYELKPADYERVRSLFRPLRYHLTSAAVIDGNSPGRVFVDDPGRPGTCFMLSPEGCYLAGDPYNEAFNSAFNQAIVVGGELGTQVRVLFLVAHPEGWREQLPSLLDPHTPTETNRRHYVCRDLCFDWRASLPDGYAVRHIDRSLLEDPERTVPEHVTGWMKNNWGTIDRFLRGGFGFATVTASEIVAWSLSDCVSGEGCEIGIRTALAHRRRGLAAITAAAMVEHALAHGFAMVGWHCPEDHSGSIGTAEKVGFRRERCYKAYYTYLDDRDGGVR